MAAIVNLRDSAVPVAESKLRSLPAIVARALIGLALVVSAVVVLAGQTVYRGYEAAAAGLLSGVATGSHDVTDRSRSIFFVNVGTPKIFGVVVTPECTSAIVTAIFLAITGITVAVARVSITRTLLAGFLAAGLFVVANLLRLVLIAFASDYWGLVSGYHWSHVWAGSFVTVFGLTIAVTVYLLILGGGSVRFGRRTPAADGGRHVR